MPMNALSPSEATSDPLRPDFVLLDSVDQLRSLANQERLAIIEALSEAPLTGAMVAKHLGLPVTRVHYHLQQLLERELIQDAGRGRKRWKEERYYVTSARHFLVHPRIGCRDDGTARALERSAHAAFLDWRRRDVLDRDQPADAVHQHARLAGAGAGQHQAVLRRRRDGFFLRGVEGTDEGRDVHAPF